MLRSSAVSLRLLGRLLGQRRRLLGRTTHRQCHIEPSQTRTRYILIQKWPRLGRVVIRHWCITRKRCELEMNWIADPRPSRRGGASQVPGHIAGGHHGLAGPHCTRKAPMQTLLYAAVKKILDVVGWWHKYYPIVQSQFCSKPSSEPLDFESQPWPSGALQNIHANHGHS